MAAKVAFVDERQKVETLKALMRSAASVGEADSSSPSRNA